MSSEDSVSGAVGAALGDRGFVDPLAYAAAGDILTPAAELIEAHTTNYVVNAATLGQALVAYVVRGGEVAVVEEVLLRLPAKARADVGSALRAALPGLTRSVPQDVSDKLGELLAYEGRVASSSPSRTGNATAASQPTAPLTSDEAVAADSAAAAAARRSLGELSLQLMGCAGDDLLRQKAEEARQLGDMKLSTQLLQQMRELHDLRHGLGHELACTGPGGAAGLIDGVVLLPAMIWEGLKLFLANAKDVSQMFLVGPDAPERVAGAALRIYARQQALQENLFKPAWEAVFNSEQAGRAWMEGSELLQIGERGAQAGYSAVNVLFAVKMLTGVLKRVNGALGRSADPATLAAGWSTPPLLPPSFKDDGPPPTGLAPADLDPSTALGHPAENSSVPPNAMAMAKPRNGKGSNSGATDKTGETTPANANPAANAGEVRGVVIFDGTGRYRKQAEALLGDRLLAYVTDFRWEAVKHLPRDGNFHAVNIDGMCADFLPRSFPMPKGRWLFLNPEKIGTGTYEGTPWANLEAALRDLYPEDLTVASYRGGPAPRGAATGTRLSELAWPSKPAADWMAGTDGLRDRPLKILYLHSLRADKTEARLMGDIVIGGRRAEIVSVDEAGVANTRLFGDRFDFEKTSQYIEERLEQLGHQIESFDLIVGYSRGGIEGAWISSRHGIPLAVIDVGGDLSWASLQAERPPDYRIAPLESEYAAGIQKMREVREFWTKWLSWLPAPFAHAVDDMYKFGVDSAMEFAHRFRNAAAFDNANLVLTVVAPEHTILAPESAVRGPQEVHLPGARVTHVTSIHRSGEAIGEFLEKFITRDGRWSNALARDPRPISKSYPIRLQGPEPSIEFANAAAVASLERHGVSPATISALERQHVLRFTSAGIELFGHKADAATVQRYPTGNVASVLRYPIGKDASAVAQFDLQSDLRYPPILRGSDVDGIEIVITKSPLEALQAFEESGGRKTVIVVDPAHGAYLENDAIRNMLANAVEIDVRLDLGVDAAGVLRNFPTGDLRRGLEKTRSSSRVFEINPAHTDAVMWDPAVRDALKRGDDWDVARALRRWPRFAASEHPTRLEHGIVRSRGVWSVQDAHISPDLQHLEAVKRELPREMPPVTTYPNREAQQELFARMIQHIARTWESAP